MFTDAKRITSLSSLLVSPHYSHHPLSQQTVWDLHKIDYYHLHHRKRAKKVQPLFNYSDLRELMWPWTLLHLSLSPSQSKIYCSFFFFTCFTQTSMSLGKHMCSSLMPSRSHLPDASPLLQSWVFCYHPPRGTPAVGNSAASLKPLVSVLFKGQCLHRPHAHTF